jgi:hypothetical protein
MTGFLDPVMRPLAKGLISQFGLNATLVREVETYDPSTGKNTVASTSYTITTSPPAPYNQNRVNGTTILQGDLQVLIAGDGFPATEPDINTDKVVFEGERWQVVASNPVYSGEQIAMWEVQLRR